MYPYRFCSHHNYYPYNHFYCDSGPYRNHTYYSCRRDYRYYDDYHYGYPYGYGYRW